MNPRPNTLTPRNWSNVGTLVGLRIVFLCLQQATLSRIREPLLKPSHFRSPERPLRHVALDLAAELDRFRLSESALV